MPNWVKENEREALKQIGKEIAKTRERKGNTQRDLADKVGTTQTSIRRMERGETNVSAVVLTRTAKALDLPLVTLLEPIQPEMNLVDKKWNEHLEQINKSVAAMGMSKDDIDFPTKRAFLRMLKLWS